MVLVDIQNKGWLVLCFKMTTSIQDSYFVILLDFVLAVVTSDMCCVILLYTLYENVDIL